MHKTTFKEVNDLIGRIIFETTENISREDFSNLPIYLAEYAELLFRKEKGESV